jgi:hypothetical protein
MARSSANNSTKTVGILVGLLMAFGSAAIPAAADTSAERGASTQLSATATTKLIPLNIAAVSHQSSYNRSSKFGPFIDADHNCQTSRAEVLITLSHRPVTFTTARECVVKSGRWTDPWSGTATTTARDFDIDHTVPLANAWRSGAWKWTQAKRVQYANDIDDVDHLVPITLSSNRSKGDKGPDEWTPSKPAAKCRYALAWNRIKARWHLSATAPEWDALVNLAASC